MDKLQKKAALALIQSAAPYNIFEHKMMKQLLQGLLFDANRLSQSSKLKLIEDLGKRKNISRNVDDLAESFRTVCYDL